MKINLKYVWIIALVVLIVFAARTLAALFHVELEFDESYNLQVPLNLYLNGHYQTWYNGTRIFNPEITTGPTVLLPIYLLFTLFSSTHPAIGRIVVFLFYLMFLYFFYRELFLKEKSGKAAFYGAAFFLLLFGVELFGLQLSFGVVGEMPGIFFLVLAFYFFGSECKSGHALAGVFLALAILTKLIFAISLAAIFIVALLEFALKDKTGNRPCSEIWVHARRLYTAPCPVADIQVRLSRQGRLPR